MKHWFILFATLLCALCAQAQSSNHEPPTPATLLVLGYGVDSLSNGQPNWQQTDVNFQVGYGPRALWEVGMRRSERFNLNDTEFSAGFAAPLMPGWSAQVSGTYSPKSDFTPRSSGAVQLTRSLAGAWDLHLTLQRRVYGNLSTNAFGAGVDKYVGDWRFASMVTYTRSNLGPIGTVARFQLDRDFGDRAKASAIVALGNELDPARPDAQVYRVSSLVLFGTIPLQPKWALRAEIGTHKLGSLYRRSGGRLGVEHVF
jgi:YaiO family outer membrane protein